MMNDAGSARTFLRAGTEYLDHLRPGGAVLAALSGGADSTALVIALHEYGGLTVFAAHFNHCLRGEESERDEQFCRDLCERLGIRIFCGRGDVASSRLKGEGTEEAARRMRYDFLSRTAVECGASLVALAHTADDQAETVLMNLARGSGADGLRGIPLTRRLAPGVTALRPMLLTTRAEVEEFLECRGERWVTDSTNLTNDYTRNFVRHEITPRMRELNVRFTEHAAAAAASLAEDIACLERLARPLAESGSASAIADAPRPIAARAVRMLAAPFIPGRSQTEAVLELCRNGAGSAQISIGGGLIARRVYDRLEIVPQDNRSAPDSRPLAPSPAPLRAGANLYAQSVITLTSATAPAAANMSSGAALWISGRFSPPFIVRPRQPGDFLRPAGRPRASLKKLFINAKIPAALRPLLPVITVDGRVAAVPGFGTDAEFLPSPGEHSWRIDIVPAPPDIQAQGDK